MNYLLDTATFLWMLFDEREKISKKALDILLSPQSKLFLSAASMWEISVKYSIGKLKLKKPPTAWLSDLVTKMDVHPLPIHIRHTLPLATLPWHHRDPFDRLLICQAKLEKQTIITPDPLFKKYHVPVVW